MTSPTSAEIVEAAQRSLVAEIARRRERLRHSLRDALAMTLPRNGRRPDADAGSAMTPSDPFPTITGTIIADDDVTAVAFDIFDPDLGRIVGVGTSRRRPGDVRDPQVGLAVAKARAFAEIADKAQALADKVVETMPENRIDLAARKRRERFIERVRSNLAAGNVHPPALLSRETVDRVMAEVFPVPTIHAFRVADLGLDLSGAAPTTAVDYGRGGVAGGGHRADVVVDDEPLHMGDDLGRAIDEFEAAEPGRRARLRDLLRFQPGTEA